MDADEVAKELRELRDGIILLTRTEKMGIQERQQQAEGQVVTVEQAMRTMTSLVAAADKVSEAARQVSSAAKQAEESNEVAQTGTAAMAETTVKINELLATMREISRKAEVISLTAALEAIRAGDAGRGFSRLATEMQTLTARLGELASEVGDLNDEIGSNTRSLTSSVSKAVHAATTTSEAASRIRKISRQQVGATQKVTAHIEEIQFLLAYSVESAGNSLESTAKLEKLGARMLRLAEELDDEPEGHQTGMMKGLDV